MVDGSDGPPTLSSAAAAVLAGGGELGARMRAIDWSKSPLGAVESWPQSLRTCVRIVLTSRQPMFVWWGEQLINLYNDPYKSIVGGKHPEALGQPASVVWREIWDQVGPRADWAMRANEGTYDEALLLIMERHGYPEETYYTFSYSPVPNDQGGTGGIICANTDDTQRIIGERQLALLRDLATRTSDARTVEEVCTRAADALRGNQRDLPFALVYLADGDRRTARLGFASGIDGEHVAAPAILQLDGDGAAIWPVAEVIRDHQERLVESLPLSRCGTLPTGAWDRPPSRAIALPIASSGQTSCAGVLVVGLSPYRLYDENYAGFLTLTAGQIAAAIASAQTYDEQKKRAEALAELDRAKTVFFSNVSHEFRTPLTLMLGPLEDALGSARRSLEGENLDTAYRNAIRLLKLVNALLDFSRIEAGRARASYEPTDLAALTVDLASAFRSAIERAGLRFDVKCEPLAEPIYVDHDMWEKIVLNLLSNALKFTFEGRIAVTLRTARDGSDGVELDVRDTGSGIPEDQLPRLFERFHRVHGARSRTHEGSGIGLALVHELVRLHGGAIRVESRVDEGTAFTITIPRGSTHLPSERVVTTRRTGSANATGATPYVIEALRWLPDENPNPVSSPPVALPHESGAAGVAPTDHDVRILLADDNADMRDYVARVLRERWTVIPCVDGVSALETARRSLPDLVLTDVMMPNLDGFGLLRALREDARTRAVPVIMLSARAGDEARVEGLEAGADDYLTKPFSARELVARVATHLQIARLRAAAEREREKLYEVFMQAPMPVAVLVGPTLRFEVANPAYCAMLGRDSFVGTNLRDAFPEIGDHPVFELLEGVYRTGETVEVPEMNVPVARPDMPTRDAFFNYVGSALRDPDGRIAGVIVVAFEITEEVVSRREREQLIEVARTERVNAERANHAKDEFLAIISHELRTPLNAVMGWLRMLRTGVVPPERQAHAMETIERNAQAQAQLVEDLLDISRIASGNMRLTVGRLDLVAVIGLAVEAVQPAADARGIRIETDLDRAAGVISGDAARLQQVVWNLLTNAVKFTPRGGLVQVSVRRESGTAIVRVSDTGKGIAPEFLPHVFERFRQAESGPTRSQMGLGLGLSIARHLAELHGGTLMATSAGLDRGATFSLQLPIPPDATDTAIQPTIPTIDPQPLIAAVRTRSEPLPRPPELRGLRVMVVDDNRTALEGIGSMLRACGMEVQLAESAEEALSMLLASPRLDVIVSDLGMPVIDGYAFIRRLRARRPDEGGRVPAIALSGYSRSEDRARALVAGFDIHVAKPIDPAELLLVIATVVGRPRYHGDVPAE